jgi:serine/threonine-protein kinase
MVPLELGRLDDVAERQEPSPNVMADWLLMTAARKRATALTLEPTDVDHRMTVEQGAHTVARMNIPSALATATIVRLGLLAGLDLRAQRDPLGRLRMQTDAGTSEILVEIHEDERGYGAALRRIATADEDGAGVASGDSLRRVGVYRIEEELGRGGMGIVYRGVHEILQKAVAIKVISETLAQRPETGVRFLREARAASRVRHAGIVDVTDFGALSDGRPFLVMELVEWPTLQDVLKKEGPLRLARAVHIAAQIAGALDAVHAHGVVHRDLKPSNLFLGPSDRIKIGDFGAARLSPAGAAIQGEQVGEAGLVVGTPFYMSPEQARAQPTDGRTDIYALGCILFRLITGALPFIGDTPLDVLLRHVSQPVPEVVSPFGPVPRWVVDVIARALAKDAADRYQRADEMLDALTRTPVA